MAVGDYSVYVDWNNDGDFADPREDVSSRVLDSVSSLTIRYGRDQARALSPISPGESSFVLNNISKDYSPENTASPLTGLVVPAREVKVTGTVGASTTTMLRAQLDDFKVHPDLGERYVEVDCIDPLGTLRDIQVSTGVYRGLRPGEAINILLDAVGWSSTLRDIDVGATVMPYWWLDGDDADQALLDLVNSEGPPALVTVDTSGQIVFRGRHHRLQDTASTTVQSTWRSRGSVEPLVSSPADYNAGFKDIINSVAFEMPALQPHSDIDVVYSSQGTQTIASGDTLVVIAQGTAPFIDAVVPVAGTDFTVVAGSVTVTLDRTSGASTTIRIVATGLSVIQDLQLRARSIDTISTVRVSSEDGGSIGTYGRRSLPSGREPKWASLGDVGAICSIILGQRADRLPTITVSMKAANSTRLTQQLTRNLSDRVHIIEGQTCLDTDCFIEQIAHTISQGGADHTTTFGLEKAATQVANVFVLGTSVLGTGVLGRRGLANPANMFVLGSVTNGVLGTNVLVP
jgi:hypothetical protein